MTLSKAKPSPNWATPRHMNTISDAEESVRDAQKKGSATHIDWVGVADVEVFEAKLGMR